LAAYILAVWRYFITQELASGFNQPTKYAVIHPVSNRIWRFLSEARLPTNIRESMNLFEAMTKHLRLGSRNSDVGQMPSCSGTVREFVNLEIVYDWLHIIARI
jgi:hypothetical protein